MIIEALIDQFLQRFQYEKRAQVCLWFDEKQEFLRLLPVICEHLALNGKQPFRLLEYDPEKIHGQIWIKHQIHEDLCSLPLNERLNRRFVIYLPLSEERLEKPDDKGEHHLELLVEYRVAGLLWKVGGKRPTLFSFLRQAGVNLPDNPSDQRRLWDGGKDSLLAKYTAKFLDRPREFWESQLTPELAQTRLIGDVDQTILDMALTPEATWSELQSKGLDREFVNAVRERYGFEGPVEDPALWVEALVTNLALTETFVGYGEPSDFPFVARLPALALRDHHVQLLRRWLRDAESRPAWDRWVKEAETKVDLSDWTSGREGLSFAFPHLVGLRWKRILDMFEQAAGKISETSEFFAEHKSMIQKEAEFSRASHLPVGSWELLSSLGDFIKLVQETLECIEKETNAPGLAGLYVECASEVDRHHLDLRRNALEDELPTIGKVADRAYADYVNSLNQRFFELLSSQEAMDISGISSINPRLDRAVWKAKGKRAVIIVDSLRYDCAREIKEALPGLEIKIEPLLAMMPAVTAIGMTALLPLAGAEVSLELSGNNLRPIVNGKDMGQRQNRLDYLADFGASCLGIEEIEELGIPPKDLRDLLVVFGHEEIDHFGHGSADALIRHLSIEVERLARLVKKLHRWGYPVVHLVTDHGFVLVDEERLPPEVPCDKAWCHVLKERYALVPSHADLPIKTYRFDWDETIRVAVPPGMAFFRREKAFSHGGATLQELIIPHLISRTHAARPMLFGVEVTLPTHKLMQGVVKVTLRVSLPEGKPTYQMGLFANVKRTLLLNVLQTEETGKKSSVLAGGHPKEVQLDPVQNKELKVSLFFHSSSRFRAGELLDLDIRDTETGEQFPPGGITLTVGRSI